MKTIRNTLLISAGVTLALMGDAPPDARFGLQLVPEAQAIFGVWRRHARRWAVVGTAAMATAATAAAVDNTEMAQQQQAAAAQQRAAAPPPPPPAASGQPLPLGTVVHSLPGGCTSTPVGGVNYEYCGGNFYRAVFQGNNLVYVTAKP